MALYIVFTARLMAGSIQRRFTVSSFALFAFDSWWENTSLFSSHSPRVCSPIVVGSSWNRKRTLLRYWRLKKASSFLGGITVDDSWAIMWSYQCNSIQRQKCATVKYIRVDCHKRNYIVLNALPQKRTAKVCLNLQMRPCRFCQRDNW